MKLARRRTERREAKWGLAFALVTLFFSTSAAAQPESPTRADALFQSARNALARGDVPAACALFASSQSLDPAAGTLLNLGDCEERRGSLVEAWTAFREAQRLLPASDARAPYALKRVAALESKLARITIRIAPMPHDMELSRDGVALPQVMLGTPVAVLPGKHVFVLRAPGFKEDRLEVTLREGDARTIELEPRPEVALAAAPAPLPTASGSAPSRAMAHGDHAGDRGGRLDPLLIGAFGVGVVGTIVGIGTGLTVVSAKSTYRQHCVDGLCDAEGSAAASRGQTLGIVSPLAFFIGAAGVGYGTYLLLKPTHKPSGTQLSAAPNGQGGAGVLVRGSF